MRGIDFTSWNGILVGMVGIALVTLIGMGLRLLMMMTIQQRRERMNRQINERLRTLIAAYKTLGGSFTGDLAVDPRRRRDLRSAGTDREDGGASADTESAAADFDRPRRIRDAVESALADVILLGTDAQVRLAEQAVRELVAGRQVQVDALVVSLRDFIRKALDLDPIPPELRIPPQGPLRPSGSGAGRRAGGQRQAGGGGGGGGAMGMGAGGAGMGASGMGAADVSGPTGGDRRT